MYQTFPPRSPRESLPTMYDLPSEAQRILICQTNFIKILYINQSDIGGGDLL